MDTVKTLVELGASINQSMQEGWTALHVASQNAQLEVVRELIGLGADIRAAAAVGPRCLLRISAALCCCKCRWRSCACVAPFVTGRTGRLDSLVRRQSRGSSRRC